MKNIKRESVRSEKKHREIVEIFHEIFHEIFPEMFHVTKIS